MKKFSSLLKIKHERKLESGKCSWASSQLEKRKTKMETLENLVAYEKKTGPKIIRS